MRRFLLFLTGILILLAAEIFRIYWLMPFPGSQQSVMVGVTHYIHTHIWLFRIAGLLLIALPVYHYIAKSKWYKKAGIIIVLCIYGLIFYFTNYIARADRMFLQPQTKLFETAQQNKISEYNQVLGVEINGEAKAYPIELIGYHHQVQDTVGGTPVMVTYCTVCRTGRVYSPLLNGKHENFRLVGMDVFNAMFEDETTHSWWRQSTGECVAGKLKGKSLDEIYSAQLSLRSWLEQYPDAKIMQPDPHFATQYSFLTDYDEGTTTDPLEATNWNSWELKSWVVGVKINGSEKAYDWNDVQQQKIINDTIATYPVLVLIENDTTTFHTYSRIMDSMVLEFMPDENADQLKDVQTNSKWNYQGQCTEGELAGKQLKGVQSYQEFWHSWKQFHPATTRYTK